MIRHFKQDGLANVQPCGYCMRLGMNVLSRLSRKRRSEIALQPALDYVISLLTTPAKLIPSKQRQTLNQSNRHCRNTNLTAGSFKLQRYKIMIESPLIRTNILICKTDLHQGNEDNKGKKNA